MRGLATMLALAALALVAPYPGFPQTTEELKALSKEIEALKQGQKSIQSDATVKTHLTNIFSKLKISRRLQLLLRQIAIRTD